MNTPDKADPDPQPLQVAREASERVQGKGSAPSTREPVRLTWREWLAIAAAQNERDLSNLPQRRPLR